MSEKNQIESVYESYSSNLCTEMTSRNVVVKHDSFDDLIKEPYYDRIIAIICTDMNLTELPRLPYLLNELWCGRNKLTSLPKLPPKLSILSAHNNQINGKLILSDKLEFIDCGNNNIEKISLLPKSLVFLKLSKNPFWRPMLDNFKDWGKYKKFQNLMRKMNANFIGEWFLDVKYNPKYKYCRYRLSKECEELYGEPLT